MFKILHACRGVITISIMLTIYLMAACVEHYYERKDVAPYRDNNRFLVTLTLTHAKGGKLFKCTYFHQGRFFFWSTPIKDSPCFYEMINVPKWFAHWLEKKTISKDI